MTPHPDRAWFTQQARNTTMHFAEQEAKPAVLLRDNNGTFGPQFDAVFAAEGVAVKHITPASPNLNARAERWVQTMKRELLDRFVVFGESHLRYLLAEFLSHYHRNRPHQSLGNAPPCGSLSPAEGPPPDPAEVVCEEGLGGLTRGDVVFAHRRRPHFPVATAFGLKNTRPGQLPRL
jgi:putative transposase